MYFGDLYFFLNGGRVILFVYKGGVGVLGIILVILFCDLKMFEILSG